MNALKMLHPNVVPGAGTEHPDSSSLNVGTHARVHNFNMCVSYSVSGQRKTDKRNLDTTFSIECTITVCRMFDTAVSRHGNLTT